jgi:hypothetical protein
METVWRFDVFAEQAKPEVKKLRGGISYHKPTGTFHVRVQIKKEVLHIGTTDTRDEAQQLLVDWNRNAG